MPSIRCNFCGDKITKPLQWVQKRRDRHFCNRGCFHKWSAEYRKRRINRRCLTCHKEFETIKAHIRGPNQGNFCSSTCWGKWHGLNSNPFKGKRHTERAKRIIGTSSRERHAILATLSGKFDKPNKKEQCLNAILERHFPKDWGFTGNGKLILNGLVPDFANLNGKKAIIELYGDFWHSDARVESWKRTELGRIMAYNSLGYRCLVIWEHELKDEQAVVSKIKQFTR